MGTGINQNEFYPCTLQEDFQCPSDELTATHAYYPPPKWILNDFNYPNVQYSWAYSSYGFNAELLGWIFVLPHRLRAKLSACPHPSDTMIMMDAAPPPVIAGANQTWEVWCASSQASLADAYMANGTSTGVGYYIFDLVRHHGKVNVLYVDGHVESVPILSTGGYTQPADAVGSPDNTPSGYVAGQSLLGGGSMAGISLNKDF